MKIHIPRAITTASLLALTPALCWAANKCTLSDGRVQYQDAPCPITAKAGSVVNTLPAPERNAEERWARATAEMKKSQDEFDARQAAARDRREVERLEKKIRHDAFCGELEGAEPAVGMSDKEFFECSGMSKWGSWFGRQEVHPVTHTTYTLYFFPQKGRVVRVADGKVAEVRIVSKGTVR